MMHGLEKSDRLTVPKKPTNKAERSAAEEAERRSLAKGNPLQDDTNRMQSRRQVNSALRRIRQAAERFSRIASISKAAISPFASTCLQGRGMRCAKQCCSAEPGASARIVHGLTVPAYYTGFEGLYAASEVVDDPLDAWD
jgi:hypothetical protein